MQAQEENRGVTIGTPRAELNLVQYLNSQDMSDVTLNTDDSPDPIFAHK